MVQQKPVDNDDDDNEAQNFSQTIKRILSIQPNMAENISRKRSTIIVSIITTHCSRENTNRASESI